MAAQRPWSGEARACRGAGAGPTYPPPASGLSPVLERNIWALQLRRQREEKKATLEERLADAITRFTGGMRFVKLHVAVLGFWILSLDVAPEAVLDEIEATEPGAEQH